MKEKIKIILKIIFLLAIISTIAMYWYDQYNYYFGKYPEYSMACPEDSNVAVINIHGNIVTYLTESSYQEESDSTLM